MKPRRPLAPDEPRALRYNSTFASARRRMRKPMLGGGSPRRAGGLGGVGEGKIGLGNASPEPVNKASLHNPH